ncbi:hypothetical protein TASIC1_0001082400 [Trichoderma asperellum]|uniref:Uncharacterized protein n=1 Tax=Trichoderma asperellum TaxID=101201 RepID=A0A6V8QKK6_TRIAP|nr:hypothetical protein TASIC1_0001082400 [Trichoderma asperellum]
MQRCHWLRQPSLAHAAAAGPVALASFGKAARGSVAGPELRRREMHAIGPMAVPANRGVQARRAAALLASDCTAMASMDLCLWLRVSRLLHPCQGSRLFGLAGKAFLWLSTREPRLALPSRRAAEIDSHSRRVPASPSLATGAVVTRPARPASGRWLAGLDAIKGLG